MRKVLVFSGLLLLSIVGVVFAVKKLTDTTGDNERAEKVNIYNNAVRGWKEAIEPYEGIDHVVLTGLPDDFGNNTLTLRTDGDNIADQNKDLLTYERFYFEFEGNLPFHTASGDFSPWVTMSTGAVLNMNGTTSGVSNIHITEEKTFPDSNWKDCVNYNDGSLFPSEGVCKVFLRSTHFCFMVGRDPTNPMKMDDDGCFGPSRGFVEKMATLSVGHESSTPSSIQLVNCKVKVRIVGDPFIAALVATHDTLDFGTTAQERRALGYIILVASVGTIVLVFITFLCGLSNKGWCVKHPKFPDFHHEKVPPPPSEKSQPPAALEPVGRPFSTIPDTEVTSNP